MVAYIFSIQIIVRVDRLIIDGVGHDDTRCKIKRAHAAGDSDTSETYYHHWLAALERIVAEKGMTAREKLARNYHALEHAADRTPDGAPY